MFSSIYAFKEILSSKKMTRKKMFAFDKKKITAEKLLKHLTKEEKNVLKDYENYILRNAGKERSREAVSEAIRYREITGNDLEEQKKQLKEATEKCRTITGKDLTEQQRKLRKATEEKEQIEKQIYEDYLYYYKEVEDCDFADTTKEKLKGYIQPFFKFHFPKTYVELFNNFKDIKFNSEAKRRKPITSDDIINSEDIKRVVKATPTLFYQTFFITQYEGGFRTGETRKSEWEKVKFDDDGFCSITVISKKNRKRNEKEREVLLKEATSYLKKLKAQQEAEGIKSKWIFPSPQNPEQPISKRVNDWFKKITTEVLGKNKYNYLLRHSRGTELKKLVKEGKVSKDNAVEFMGHSEKMFDKVYNHMDKKEIKELMKQQIYNLEEDLTPEQKSDYEKKINELQEKVEKLEGKWEFMEEFIQEYRRDKEGKMIFSKPIEIREFKTDEQGNKIKVYEKINPVVWDIS